ARDEDVVTVALQPLDQVRSQEAPPAGDEDPHAGDRSAASQSTRPIQRSRFAAYHAIVRETPSSQGTVGSQPVSRFSFSYPTRSAITSLAPGRKRSGTETTSRAGQCPSASPTRRINAAQSPIEMFLP